MITYNKHRCIVKESEKLRTLINKEISKNFVTGREIVTHAKKRGLKFNEQSLSRYRKHGNVTGALSTSDVIWICDLLKINLILTPKKTR